MNRLTHPLPQTTSLAPAVGVMDRFGFTLFMAIAVHAILLLGISFSAPDYKPPRKTLDITLARFETPEAPKEADFLAQANQLGSGTADEKRAPSTLEEAPFHSNESQQQAMMQSQPTAQTPVEVVPAPVPVPVPTPKVKEQPSPKTVPRTEKVVTTTAPAKQKSSDRTPSPEVAKPPPPAPGASTSLLARSLEIASLQAKLDLQQEQYAKKPKIRRLTSASTLKSVEAPYYENWKIRVEHYGNLNYPTEARAQGIYGSLRLLVSILPDGSVKDIEVLKSSGFKVLDDAAVSIVRLAAPFQSFPVEMRKNTDVLEIIRTWKFENQTRLY